MFFSQFKMFLLKFYTEINSKYLAYVRFSSLYSTFARKRMHIWGNHNLVFITLQLNSFSEMYIKFTSTMCQYNYVCMPQNFPPKDHVCSQMCCNSFSTSGRYALGSRQNLPFNMMLESTVIGFPVYV